LATFPLDAVREEVAGLASVTRAEQTGAALERLRWLVELGGKVRGIDLAPAAIGRLVTVLIDGRSVRRMPKPTPQHPWREAAFRIDNEAVLVGLIWHFPVMWTDVFVGGRSVRDGRLIEIVRADAPAALSNYETWFGAMFRTPFFGSRPRPPRAWPVVVAACALIWVAAFALSPFPPALRLVAGGALLVSGILLMLALVWSLLAFGQRVHRELLARPSLGEWRVALWFLAFAGYVLLIGVVAVGLPLALAAT
jgi:hypothetical protein